MDKKLLNELKLKNSYINNCEECSICYNDYTQIKSMYLLENCNHIFCKLYIFKLMDIDKHRQNVACPLCRTENKNIKYKINQNDFSLYMQFLSNQNLTNQNLTNQNLTNQNLTNQNLTNQNLTNQNLTASTITINQGPRYPYNHSFFNYPLWTYQQPMMIQTIGRVMRHNSHNTMPTITHYDIETYNNNSNRITPLNINVNIIDFPSMVEDTISGVYMSNLNMNDNLNNNIGDSEDNYDSDDELPELESDNTSTFQNQNTQTQTQTQTQTESDEQDIQIVMCQSHSTREEAINALRNNDNDIINAIMELTM